MKNKDNEFNEAMEEQIGNMGGEQAGAGEELKDFGKLHHIPGQKEELSEDEQKSRDAFENAITSKRGSKTVKIDHKTNDIHEY